MFFIHFTFTLSIENNAKRFRLTGEGRGGGGADVWM